MSSGIRVSKFFIDPSATNQQPDSHATSAQLSAEGSSSPVADETTIATAAGVSLSNETTIAAAAGTALSTAQATVHTENTELTVQHKMVVPDSIPSTVGTPPQTASTVQNTEIETPITQPTAVVADAHVLRGPVTYANNTSLGSIKFHEKNLDDGSAPKARELTKLISLPKNYTLDTSDWEKSGSIYSKETSIGVLKYNGHTLTFTLTKSVTHGVGTTDKLISEEVSLIVKNKSGAPEEHTLEVRIEDDTPEVFLFTEMKRVPAGGAITGGWVIKYGADGAPEEGAAQVSFDNGRTFTTITVGSPMTIKIGNITYGEITFKEDKTFVFESVDSAPNGRLQLTLKGTDADGDSVTKDMGLIIFNSTSGISGNRPSISTVLMNEEYLDEGTNPSARFQTKEIMLPKGFSVNTAGWENDNGTMFKEFENGRLEYKDSKLYFVMTTAVAHGAGAKDNFVDIRFPITLKDKHDNPVERDLTVRFEDDNPVVKLASPVNKIVAGEELTGFYNILYGADGAANDKPLQVSFDNGRTFTTVVKGTSIDVTVGSIVYGTITFGDNNEYHFKANENAPGGKISIQLKAEDGDGDRATSTISLTITPSPAPSENIATITVDEAHLENGTNSNTSERAKVINLPNGYTVDTTGWQGEAGSYYTNVDGGQLHYNGKTLTFVFNTAFTHGEQNSATDDSITVKLPVTLTTGNKSSSHTITVVIKDDAPTLNVDATVASDDKLTYTGEWEYSFGADRPGTIAVKVGDETLTVTLGQPVVTDSGVTITFNENGTFSVTRGNSSEAIDMTIIVTDKDGDKAQQQITIDAIQPTELTVTVDEANLPNGTAANKDALYQTISLPKGTTVNTTGWEGKDGSYYKSVEGGELHYDGTTLSYVLQQAVTHGAAGTQTDTQTVVKLPITLIKDGVDQNSTISLTIKDDAPTLTIDQLATNDLSTYTGKWTHAFGADQPGSITIQVGDTTLPVTIGQPVETDSGFTVTFNEDGTFSVIRESSSNAVDMTIIVTDKDGDTAKQLIKIEATPTIDLMATVDEANLANGTNADDKLLTSTITIDGWKVDTTGWEGEAGNYYKTVEGGQLRYNGTTLSYVLQESVAHGAEGSQTDENVSITLPINLIGPDGSRFTTGIQLTIKDDAPTLSIDPNTTSEDQLTYTGQWTYAFGADQPGSIAIKVGDTTLPVTIGQPIETESGFTITFKADGTYSVTRENSSEVIDLTIVITDKDGDEVENRLTIDAIPPTELAATVDEANLPTGTSHNEKALTQTITLPQGTTVNTTGWEGEDGNYYKNVEGGQLRYDGTTLSYVLQQAVTHERGTQSDTQTVVELPITLVKDGVDQNSTISLTIKDDAPTLTIDTPVTTEDLNTYTGKWTHAFGADAPGELSIMIGNTTFPVTIGQPVETENGLTATFNEDGTFSVTRANSNTAVDITIIVTDKDGDIAEHQINIDATPTIDLMTTVDEANLANGTSPDDKLLTSTINIDGWKVDTTGWEGEAGNYYKDVEGGQLRYNGTTLSYVLQESVAHGAEGSQTDENVSIALPINLIGSDGSRFSTAIDLTIKDDVPTLSIVPNTTSEDQLTFTGQWTYAFGADQPGSIAIKVGDTSLPVTIGQPVETESGFTITFKADGTYSVTRENSSEAIDLTIVITDKDGDTVENRLTIDAVPPAELAVTVDEANLPTGTSHDEKALTQTIALPQGTTVNTTGWEGEDGNYYKNVDGGQLRYDGTTLSYVLQQAVTHERGTQSDTQTVVELPITLVKDGVDQNSTINLTIKDDIPTLTIDTPVTTEDLNTYTGKWTHAFGADAPGELSIMIGNTTFPVTIGQPVETENGLTATFNEDGTFSVTRANSNTAVDITIIVTDKDGDIAEHQINIDATPTIDLLATVDEANLANGTSPDEKTLTATINIDGWKVDTTGWEGEAGNYYKNVEGGQLRYNDTTLTYVLEKNVSHGVFGGETDEKVTITLPIDLIASDGSRFTTGIQLTIKDDAPILELGTPSATNIVGGFAMSGEITKFALGADITPDSQLEVSFDGGKTYYTFGQGLDVTIDGINYGTITYNASTVPNSYVFQAAENAPSTDLNFIFKAADTDGDIAVQEMSLHITGADEAMSKLTVYEKYMDTNNIAGTAASKDNQIYYPIIPEGHTVDTTSWKKEGDTFTYEAANGIFTYDGTSLTFMLTSPVNHNEFPDGINKPGLFNVPFTLLDSEGKPVSTFIIIDVIDDIPTMNIHEAEQIVNVGKNDLTAWQALYGADREEKIYYRLNDDEEFRPITFFEPMDLILNGINYGTIYFTNDGHTVLQIRDNVPSTEFILHMMVSDTDSKEIDPASRDSVKMIVKGQDILATIEMDEAHLEAGTKANPDELVKIISLPEGYTLDTTGWVQDGTTFSKEVSNGILTYDGTKLTYTLTASALNNVQGQPSITDTMATVLIEVGLKDSEDKPVTQLIQLNIKDDQPLADVKLLQTDDDIIAPGETASGVFHVIAGADGLQKATVICSITLDDKTTEVALDVSLSEGTSHIIKVGDIVYGTLEFQKDGHFTFTAAKDQAGGVALNMQLIVVDKDGDEAKSDLTLQIETPSTGGTYSFNESHLENGTEPTPDELIKTIELPYGYRIDTADWDSRDGKFYFPVSPGEFCYDGTTLTYRLTESVTNNTSSDLETQLHHLAVFNANNKPGHYDITIEIYDDKPIVTLGSETGSAPQGESIEGTWQAHFGADGPYTMQPALQFKFGTSDWQPVVIGTPTEVKMGDIVCGAIVFNENGTFVFTADAKAPAADYKLSLLGMDGDSDAVLNQISLTITPGGGLELSPITVNEANLPGGSDRNPDSLIKTILLPEGYKVQPSGWIKDNDLFILSVDGGKFVYDGTTLQFHLTANVQHGLPGSGTDKSLVNKHTITLINGEGSTADYTIKVTIEDDQPTLTFGTSVTPVLAGFETILDMSMHIGADMPNDAPQILISLDGGKTFSVLQGSGLDVSLDGAIYGTLYRTADGKIGFMTNSANGPDKITDIPLVVKVIDSDGDAVDTPHTIRITPLDQALADIRVSEASLPEGTQSAAELLTHTITIPEGYSLDTTGWQKDGDTFVFMHHGKFTYDGKNLVYTLTEAEHNASGSTDAAFVTQCNLTFTNKDGDKVQLPVRLEIRDDAPTIDVTVNDKIVKTGESVDGSWEHAFGADGPANAPYAVSLNNGNRLLVELGKATPLTIDGQTYGTITLADDKTYTFTASENAPAGLIHLSLWVADGDGDWTSSTSIELTIEPAKLEFDPLLLSESNLATGTDAQLDALSKTITLPKGCVLDVTKNGWGELQDDGCHYLNTEFGKYVYDVAKGTITAVLEKAISHGEMEQKDYELELHITTPQGSKLTSVITVQVADDHPIVELQSENSTVNKGEEISGSWNIKSGADVPAGTAAMTVAFEDGGEETTVAFGKPIDVIVADTKVGVLVINEDKTFTFAATSNAPEIGFTITLSTTDADGSKTSLSLPLAIGEGTPPPPDVLANLSLNEAHLANGTDSQPDKLESIIELPKGYVIDTSTGNWAKVEGKDSLYSINNASGTLYYDTAEGKAYYVHSKSIVHAEDADTASDSIAITLINSATQKSSEHVVKLEIIDDAPVISAEAVGFVEQTGHVTGEWSHNYGADGPGVITLKSLNGFVHEQEVTFGKALEVSDASGKIGTITFTANGEFTFEPITGLTKREVTIELTISDHDGDTKTATCSFTADGSFVNNEINVGSIYEKYLVDGTEPDAKLCTKHADMPEGMTLRTEGWKLINGVYERADATTIIQYNPETKKFSITLTRAIDHKQNEDMDEYVERTHGIVLIDNDGKEHSYSLTIGLYDDKPVIKFTSETTKLDAGATMEGEWDVKFGADRAAVDGFKVSFDGGKTFKAIILDDAMEIVAADGVKYGYITFNNTGKYFIQTLKDVPNANIGIMVQATDRDADKVTSEISFTIENKDLSLDAIEVKEAHLPEGTEALAEALTKIITLPANYTVDTEGWQQAGTVFTKEVANGVLAFNGTTLTYTLTSNEAHAANADTTEKLISVPLKNNDGATVEFGLSVSIVDDSPALELSQPTAPVNPEGTVSGTWAYAPGADGPAETAAISYSTDGGKTFLSLQPGVNINIAVGTIEYGYIRLNTEDNTYTFVAAKDAPSGSLEIIFRAQDSDGDTTQQTVTIPIQSKDIIIEELELFEQYLPDGTKSDPNLTTQPINIPEGYKVVTEGWDHKEGVYTKQVANGLLSYSDGKLTYTLTENAPHTEQGSGDIVKTLIDLTLEHANGDHEYASVTVNIVDDAPTLSIKSANEEITAGTLKTVELDLNYGADNAAVTTPLHIKFGETGEFVPLVESVEVQIVLDGTTYGYATLMPNGTISIQTTKETPNGDLPMTIRATDSDGDHTTTNYTFTISDGSDPILNLATLNTREQHLENGTHPLPEALQKGIILPDGYKLDTTGWQQDDTYLFKELPYGKLISNGEYFGFILTNSSAHDKATADLTMQQVINITLLNEDDKPSLFTVTVNIEDDAPLLTITTDTQLTAKAGETITNNWGLIGADGFAETGGCQISFDGTTYQNVSFGKAITATIGTTEYGTFTFNSDGTFSFTAADDATPTTFDVLIKMTDSDGDTAQSTFQVHVEKAEPEIHLGRITVDEIDLTDRGNAENLTHSLPIPEGYSVVIGEDWIEEGNRFLLKMPHGTLLYDGTSLSFTLEKAAQHQVNEPTDEKLSDIAVILLRDAKGIVTEHLLTVDIVDDTPSVQFSTGDKTLMAGTSIVAHWEPEFGADLEGSSLNFSYDGGKTYHPVRIIEPHNVVIDGATYGTIRFVGDNVCTFEAALTAPKGDITFMLKATDGDGDSATEQFTLTITEPNFGELSTIVHEKHLPKGTEAAPEKLLQIIDLPEGWKPSLTQSGWEKDGSIIFKEVDGGKLVYDGKELSFELLSSVRHAPDTNVKEIETLVKLENTKGETKEATITVVINDDMPTLDFSLPSDDLTAGEQYRGSWSANFGADGKANSSFEISFDGGLTFQKLTLGVPINVEINELPYGEFVVTENHQVVFNSLKTAPNGEINFVLKAIDGDGDAVVKSSSFTIVDGGHAPDSNIGTVTVSEKNLENGTQPLEQALTQLLDLPKGYTINTSDKSWTLEGNEYVCKLPFGILTYTAGATKVAFTLTDSVDSSVTTPSTHTDMKIPLVLQNTDGKNFNVEMTAHVLDDSPVVSIAIGSDTVRAGQSITGEWAINYGADGPFSDSPTIIFETETASTSLSWSDEPITVKVNETVYGVLTFSKDTYEFKADANCPAGPVEITLLAKDNDGDKVERSVEINIKQDIVPDPVFMSVNFDEKFLKEGTAPNSAELLRNVILPKEYIVDTSSNSWKQEGDLFVLERPFGKLTYQPGATEINVVFSNALSDNNTVLKEAITLQNTISGRKYETAIEVSVKDDEPLIFFEADDTTVIVGEELTGLWNIKFGADGASKDAPIQLIVRMPDNQQTEVSLTIGKPSVIAHRDMPYGTFTLNEDGTFSFTPAKDALAGALEIQLVAQDTDKTETAQIISLTVGEPEPVIYDLGTAKLDEQHLGNGSHANSSKLVQRIDLPEGFVPDTTDWKVDGTTFTKEHGSFLLVYKANSTEIRIELLGNAYHDAESPTNGNVLISKIELPLNATQGFDTAVAHLTVAITDDEPVVRFSGLTGTSIANNVSGYGTWYAGYGADGPAEKLALTVSINGGPQQALTVGTPIDVVVDKKLHGSLLFNSDGTYVFTPAADAPAASINATISVTDGDGDTNISTTSLVIRNAPETPESVLAKITVDEASLAPENLPAHLVPPTHHIIAVPHGYTVDTSKWQSQVLELEYGIIGYDSKANTLTFILQGNTNSTASTLVDSVAVTLLDDKGGSSDHRLEITIADDKPVSEAGFTVATVAPDGLFTDTWLIGGGADGLQKVEISFDGGKTFEELHATDNGYSTAVPVNGKNYGLITLHNDGTFEFQAASNTTTGGLSLTIRATDNDGSTATSNAKLYIGELAQHRAMPLNEDTLDADQNEAASILSQESDSAQLTVDTLLTDSSDMRVDCFLEFDSLDSLLGHNAETAQPVVIHDSESKLLSTMSETQAPSTFVAPATAPAATQVEQQIASGSSEEEMLRIMINAI